MPLVFVYVTTSSEAEAAEIARSVVSDRLAACANIFPAIKSIYHWEGQIAENVEAVLILKTRKELFPPLEQRIRELHSYKTPCIIALPVENANSTYRKWILAETKP